MINVAIEGYGSVGRFTLEAIRATGDMNLVGVIRRQVTKEQPIELQGIAIVDDVERLETRPDVVLLCIPSRMVPKTAEAYLKKGIHTVDCFDIHGDIGDLRGHLHQVAVEDGAVSVLSAGWDPGSDSVVRALLEGCAPKGITNTNFGPGMSMGHTVAVKAIDGVRDALSMTIPLGTSIHRRMVYITLEDGADFNTAASAIKADPYFVHDETHVLLVDDVQALIDMGHSTLIQRKGVSGATHNQLFSFSMTINNPALTSQVMVSCARAAMRQQPGCYTMIELPPIDLLEGDRDSLVRRLV